MGERQGREQQAGSPAGDAGPTVDLVVVGGGINGCGIARDAAGRGLSVLLVEQGDLGGATSSASTKLIHGGLRYLERYEFRLVREALAEREVLLAAAPHIVRPLRFVLPHHEGLRPVWLLRLGLFLYDRIGGRRSLPGTRTLDLRTDPVGAPLKPDYVTGFEYSDCWVEDARLVVLNAMAAAEAGAGVRVGCRCVGARRAGTRWEIEVEERETGARETVSARALVNATGPWAGDFAAQIVGSRTPARVRLVKGSHVVVPRLFEHDRAYIFQNTDGRIVFAIPYEGDFTLIGTTDRDFDGDPACVAISEEETAYLCAAVSDYFAAPVRPADVAWSFAGVRPLYDDGNPAAQAATRDYVLTLDAGEGGAPLLNVFGGKITTYRKLAEAALSRLSTHLPAAGGAWTGAAALPGGDLPAGGLDALVRDIAGEYPFLAPGDVRRLAGAYGTRARRLLGTAEAADDLGRRFGDAGPSEAEVRYLMDAEWARTADDVVWRRSKLGLRMSADEVADLDRFMAARRRAASFRAA